MNERSGDWGRLQGRTSRPAAGHTAPVGRGVPNLRGHRSKGQEVREGQVAYLGTGFQAEASAHAWSPGPENPGVSEGLQVWLRTGKGVWGEGSLGQCKDSELNFL